MALTHNHRVPSTPIVLTPKSAPCLYAITAQSNISNSKTPLSLAHYAASIGYHVLLDAAALAPTSILSLSDSAVDAMAISFYKMFGFPTGVGALIAKKTFLQQLRRPWFAGGTVDIVQVPGEIMTRARQIHEQFEVRSWAFIRGSLTLSPNVILGWDDQLPIASGYNEWTKVPF